MRLRSLVRRPINWALEQAGFANIRHKFGYDSFLDIQRLSKVWNYPINVYFDVGANDGETIARARRKFRNCRITAFEPHPKTFLTLTENVRGQNAELVNVALGASEGNMTMFEYDQSVLNSLLSNAQFAVRFGTKARQIQVPCTTLDNYCSEHGVKQIDVLKIDTEGFDFEVLKGAGSMLARNAIKFIYFEFNDIHLHSDASGGALAPIDQLLCTHRYRFIATYNDYVVPTGELFLVSNALYALPPMVGTATPKPR